MPDKIMQHTILLQKGLPRNPLIPMKYPASIDILADEHIALIGPNGAGKSLVTDILAGKYILRSGTITYDFRPSTTKELYNNIKYITFRDTYQTSDTCYQLRWNQTEQDDIPLVRALLGSANDRYWQEHIFDIFGINKLLDKKIVALSSGELRKFQLAKALLHHPRILIIDNPYIGLDVSARQVLTNVLTRFCAEGSIQIILILSRPEDIPPFITHVIPVSDGRVLDKVTYEQYLCTIQEKLSQVTHQLTPQISKITKQIQSIPIASTIAEGAKDSRQIIHLSDVSIRYGSHTILSHLSWTVNQGEKWALLGKNGSGKSTLLSLICADNPQSYACNISLFGHKRGSGESIWDIKKHIGYVSPEMHKSYLRNLPAIDIVASGLHDTIGLYTHPNPEQMETCRFWMEIFGVEQLQSKSFIQLSSGEQRLVLLARAFVKDPELLILDEPLHGLDYFNRIKVKAIIEAFVSRPGKTAIMVTHYPDELPASFTHTLNLSKPI